jgi:hypothetical protein
MFQSHEERNRTAPKPGRRRIGQSGGDPAAAPPSRIIVCCHIDARMQDHPVRYAVA